MISGTHKSGLRYAVKRSGSAVGYCALSIGVGTRDEKGFHNGIAHFTEHCLFKGTKRKTASRISSYLDSLGGELNAYTTKEEIVLHATVLKEDLRKACPLLLELITESTFPENEINTERSVIIDEILSYKDSPADDVYDHFESDLFSGHELSPMVLGTVESVRKITPAGLRRFVAEKFVPCQMAFSIVADVDEKRLEKYVNSLADKVFAGIVSEPSQPYEGLSEGIMPCRNLRSLQSPVPHNVFDRTEDKHNHEVNAVIGGLAPSLYGERERYTAILMSNLLGGPASNSILNRTLREKNGWVYGVESSYTQYADTGMITISLGCDRSNLDKCLAAVKKEILKLQMVPLSAARLKAAKKQLLGQLAISSDNGEAQCLSMCKSLLSFGMIEKSERTRERIESITAEEIQSLCCKVFSKDNVSKLIYL